MSEKNVNKKKKSVGVIVLIIALILIIIGMGFYIAYDKGFVFADEKVIEKDENKAGENKNEDIVEKDISLDDSRFLGIYTKLSKYTYKQNKENGYNSFTDTELGIIAATELQESDFTKTAEVDQWGIPYYTFKGDVLVKYLQKYFENSVTLNKTSLVNLSVIINVNFDGSGMMIESYDSNSDEFKVRFSGVGGTTGPVPTIIERKIISAKEKSDIITIQEKAIYYTSSSYNGTACYSIYADPSMLKLLESKTYDESTVSNETLSVDSYIDNASTITQTYKLDEKTGNYYFVSSVIK